MSEWHSHKRNRAFRLRKVKRDQRKLAENSKTLGDIYKTSANTFELLGTITDWQTGVGMRISAMEHQITSIHHQLMVVSDVLAQQRPAQQPSLRQQAVDDTGGQMLTHRRPTSSSDQDLRQRFS